MPKVYDDQDTPNKESPLNKVRTGEGVTPHPSPSSTPSEPESSLYHPGEGDAVPDSNELEQRERGGGSSPSSVADSLYKPLKKKMGKEVEHEVKKVATSKVKKYLFEGAAGGGGILTVLILIVFISSLVIPNFAQNMIEWQFARAAKNFTDRSDDITEEKEALDSESPADQAATEAEFANETADEPDMLQPSDLQNYNPETVEQKLQGDTKGVPDQIDYNETDGQITSITDEGRTITPDQPTPSDFASEEHGVEDFGDDSSLESLFSSDLANNLDGINSVITGEINKSILQNLGIDLEGWTPQELEQYSKDDSTQADGQDQEDTYKVVDDQDALSENTGETTDQQSGAQNAAQEEEQCLTDPSCALKTAEDGGEEPASVISTLAGLMKGSLVDTALNDLAVVPAIAIPLCVIYSGSLDNAGPSINAQDTELERTAYLTDSRASQEENGLTNARAVGAFSDKLGQVSQSIPEERASGETVSTSSIQSPQSSATTSFSLFNAFMDNLPAGSFIASFFNHVAEPFCGVVTNPAFVASAIAANIAFNILGDIFTGGGATAGETAAEGTVEATTEAITEDAVESAVESAAESTAEAGGEEASQSALSNLAESLGNAKSNIINVLKKLGVPTTKKELTNQVALFAAVGGTTMLAKLYVMQQAGINQSGVATGTSFDNSADAGNNLAANQIDQQEFYGAPMTNQESNAANNASRKYVAQVNSAKSTYQRYFAISNVNSLASQLLTKFAVTFNASSFTSIISKIGDIINPIDWFSKLFGSAQTAAASNTDDQDYGIVQWDWSPAEEAKINSSPSFQPLENQATLDSLGTQTISNIQSTYGQCFTDDMGTLLSQGLILRDSTGDVIANQGSSGAVCSPCNLTFNNNSSIGCDPNQDPNDAVFRWRLAMSTKNTLDQLTAIQNGPAVSASTL